MTDKTVPAGFEPINFGKRLAEAFGPVYLNQATATLGFRVAPNHLNPVEVCNGGAMATFAELQIAAVVLYAKGAAKGRHSTVNLSMDFVAVARFDAWVEASVKLINKTPDLIFTQALIVADGNLVVRSSAIYRNEGFETIPLSA